MQLMTLNNSLPKNTNSFLFSVTKKSCKRKKQLFMLSDVSSTADKSQIYKEMFTSNMNSEITHSFISLK